MLGIISMANLNLFLEYFFLLSVGSLMGLISIYGAVNTHKNYVLPIAIFLDLSLIAFILALVWKYRGFVPKNIDPRFQKKYQIGHALVALGNIIFIVIVLSSIFMSALHVDPVIGGLPVLFGQFPVIVGWFVGQHMIKKSALEPVTNNLKQTNLEGDTNENSGGIFYSYASKFKKIYLTQKNIHALIISAIGILLMSVAYIVILTTHNEKTPILLLNPIGLIMLLYGILRLLRK
jgi:hypothetical protein